MLTSKINALLDQVAKIINEDTGSARTGMPLPWWKQARQDVPHRSDAPSEAAIELMREIRVQARQLVSNAAEGMDTAVDGLALTTEIARLRKELRI